MSKPCFILNELFIWCEFCGIRIESVECWGDSCEIIVFMRLLISLIKTFFPGETQFYPLGILICSSIGTSSSKIVFLFSKELQ